MKLEASLKHFSPQGMHINDDVKKHIAESPEWHRHYDRDRCDQQQGTLRPGRFLRKGWYQQNG